MNKELVTNWINALRSGKYEQTKDCIRKGDCFCALGVLLDIANPNAWQLLPQTNDYAYYGRTNEIYEQINFREIEIVELNDDKKLSFQEIANWIEKNFLNM